MITNNNIILLRHYIFINPYNLEGDINNDNILNDIKKIHKENYTNGEIVRYYGYYDIVNLLKNYDDTLHSLFLELNCNYPALLADIGRLIILYTYGGIYHDLKFMSNHKMIDYLNNVSSKIEIIGEEHPKYTFRVRNSNIVALHKNSKFIASVLQKIKNYLDNNKDAFGAQKAYKIGSEIYINNFLKNTNECIYKYPFVNNDMIKGNSEIYSKNIKKWQTTNEYIFKNKYKILFMHFHKSFGTSFVNTFKSKFKLHNQNMNGNPWVENSHVILFNEMNDTELVNWCNSIDCNLLCLEWNFFTNFNILHSKLFNFITILRDPYDRFISTYMIYCSKKENHKVSLWDFCSKKFNNFYIGGKMQKCKNQKVFPIIINEFNYYTKMINGLGNTHNSEVNEYHYKNAIKILKNFDIKTDIHIKSNNYNYNNYGIDKIYKNNVNINKTNIVIDNKFKQYFIKNNLYDYKIYNFFLSNM